MPFPTRLHTAVVCCTAVRLPNHFKHIPSDRLLQELKTNIWLTLPLPCLSFSSCLLRYHSPTLFRFHGLVWLEIKCFHHVQNPFTLLHSGPFRSITIQLPTLSHSYTKNHPRQCCNCAAEHTMDWCFVALYTVVPLSKGGRLLLERLKRN